VTTTAPPGWYPDPFGRHDHRWWEGTHWTSHVASDGFASEEPETVAPVSQPAGAALPLPGVPAAPLPQPEVVPAPTRTVAPRSRRAGRADDLPGLLVGFGALLALVAWPLPWVRPGSGLAADVFGPDRLAVVLMAFSLIGFSGLLLAGWQPRLSALGAIVVAVLGAAVAIPDIAATGVPAGAGLWAALAGSGLAIVGGALAYLAAWPRRAGASTAEVPDVATAPSASVVTPVAPAVTAPVPTSVPASLPTPITTHAAASLGAPIGAPGRPPLERLMSVGSKAKSGTVKLRTR
jgi:hypothetical protein